MATNLQLISLNIDKDLLTNIKNLSNEISMSDFIRKAIENELNKQANSKKTQQEKQKKSEDFIKNTESKLGDIETKMMIYHERTSEVLNKQNDILKTIYKQSTIGANFAMHIMDTITKSKEFRKAEYATLLEIIQQEINKYF